MKNKFAVIIPILALALVLLGIAASNVQTGQGGGGGGGGGWTPAPEQFNTNAGGTFTTILAFPFTNGNSYGTFTNHNSFLNNGVATFMGDTEFAQLSQTVEIDGFGNRFWLQNGTFLNYDETINSGSSTYTNGSKIKSLWVPMTVSGTNLTADIASGTWFSNAVASSGATNINVINIDDGMAGPGAVKLKLWVTNGTQATLLLDGASPPASWYSDGIATTIASNCLTTVCIERIGSWTNITVTTAPFTLVFGPSTTATTNLVNNTITINAKNPAPFALTGGGTGGTNLFIDFSALYPTNDCTFTIGSSNIAIVATNVIAGRLIRIAITQASAGFGTCSTNVSYPNSIRIGTTVTGFNCTTNGGFVDAFSLYGVGTNALLVGNVMGFAP